MPTPEQSSRASSSRAAAKHKVLACVLCQRRKVKCERKFPCANCIRAGVQCVPATAPTERRRRFPERELLERLRSYEGLLRQNNIKFEPLHAPATKNASLSDGRGSRPLDDAHSEEPTVSADRPATERTAVESETAYDAVKSETIYEAKSLWQAMKDMSRGPMDNDNDDECDESESDSAFLHDNVRENIVKKAWDQTYESNDHLMFGSRMTNIDLSTLHPGQLQIFRLWQIYLENVDPLLKVTHSPTLQASIIDAASDMGNVSAALEALMFSIYCVSILSLAEDDCYSLFGSPRRDLLTNYQFGCRQALLKCEFLRSSDCDCLTALYLYLVSVRPDSDPRSLSSMLGAALRIAQRMGIHKESTYANCTALEAEMRRRLWWSLIIFDHRIAEMSDQTITMLNPTWNCRTPLNVNDIDLRSEMKTAPEVHEKPTEALFAVVRSELNAFLRHLTFHLDFTNPSLKTISKDHQHGFNGEDSELVALENLMEDKYLAFCNPENPLHFMTIWTARSHLAKYRLLESFSRNSTSSMHQTETQRGNTISYALNMLDCDTKLMTSPLTKRYLWLIQFHFPFPAYIRIVQDLRNRPMDSHAGKAWEVMSDNYDARFVNVEPDNLFFKIFWQMIFQAWEVREAVFSRLGQPLEVPRIVSNLKERTTQAASTAQNSNLKQPHDAMSSNIDEFSMPMSMDFIGHNLPEQATIDVDMNELNWNTIDWDAMHSLGW